MKLVHDLAVVRPALCYRAHDTVTGDIVALKILHSHLAVPWQELRLARKITHPNVCRLHDLFEEDGQTLISMEFVDGETLKALMERSGVLTVEHTLTIIRQILDGLEAGHRRRIIHRDLKPSNIMIALDGTVKIMDFGLARTEEESGPDVTLSEIAGTSGYVAPDQAIGHTASLRMDLYSVGVILYEMVCGRSASARDSDVGARRSRICRVCDSKLPSNGSLSTSGFSSCSS